MLYFVRHSPYTRYKLTSLDYVLSMPRARVPDTPLLSCTRYWGKYLYSAVCLCVSLSPSTGFCTHFKFELIQISPKRSMTPPPPSFPDFTPVPLLLREHRQL